MASFSSIGIGLGGGVDVNALIKASVDAVKLPITKTGGLQQQAAIQIDAFGSDFRGLHVGAVAGSFALDQHRRFLTPTRAERPTNYHAGEPQPHIRSQRATVCPDCGGGPPACKATLCALEASAL